MEGRKGGEEEKGLRGRARRGRIWEVKIRNKEGKRDEKERSRTEKKKEG